MKSIPDLDGVKPVDNERFVYEVQSRSRPGFTHRVDKSSWYGSGACSCEWFCCQVQPELGKGNWTGISSITGKRVGTTCPHIDLVDRWYSCMSARRAIEEMAKLKPGYRYSASEPNL